VLDFELVFADSPPKIECISTQVTKAVPKDVIIHTVRLQHKGFEWFVTITRSELRELFKKLKQWEIFTKSVSAYQNFKSRVKRTGSVDGDPEKPASFDEQIVNPVVTESPKNVDKKVSISAPDGLEMIEKDARESLEVIKEADKERRKKDHKKKQTHKSMFHKGRRMSLDAERKLNKAFSSFGEQDRVTTGTVNNTLDFDVSDEIRDTNRRLKRYIPILLSPLFYRTDKKSLDEQRQIIENFLNDAMLHPRNRTCPDFLAFLEVSAMSFDEHSGPSLMEGYVKIRCTADNSDRRLRQQQDRACCGKTKGFHCLCCVCFCFRKRFSFKRKQRAWAVLKPGCLSFYKSRLNKEPIDAIMFQPSTVVADQLSTTGSRNGALIVDSAWMCELKFDNIILQKTWTSAIKEAVLQCPYVERSRFIYESTDTTSLIKSELGSHTCQSQWFVNGKAYYSHLYDALNEAKWQILLSGWFLSADIYLKRPIKGNEDSMVAKVIERACQRGVKVYIMIYHEPVVVAHNTTYTLERFQNLDHMGNLHILRHGDPAIPYFWSHHDKHVTIDQEVAFLGGVDITFGRYDDSEYLLRDENREVTEMKFPGADYANPRIGDVLHPEIPLEDNDLHDRKTIPRMPWRDIHSCIKGTVALDVAWHFIQRWNYTRYVNSLKESHPAITPSGLGNLALSWLDRVNSLPVVEDGGAERESLFPPKGFIDSSGRNASGKGIETSTLHKDTTWANKAAKIPKNFIARRGSIVEKVNEKVNETLNALQQATGIRESAEHQQKQQQAAASAAEIKSVMRKIAEAENRPGGGGSSEFAAKKNKKSRRTSIAMIQNIPGARINQSNRGFGMGGGEKEAPEAGGYTRPKLKSRHSKRFTMDSSWIKKSDRVLSHSSDDQSSRNDAAEGKGDDNARPARKGRQSIADMFEGHKEVHMDTPLPAAAPLLEEWGKEKSVEFVEKNHSNSATGDLVQCKTTIVRSYSQWSAGLSETEDGIHEAYKQLIQESRHYIYMENQFFVSACGDNDNVIGNTIANNLFSRIMKAVANEEKFRIVVTMPLVPGMTGAIKGDGMSGIGCVMYFQFRTISRGGNSLFERLRRHGVDPDEYIFFTGLRTHQEFKNTIETEMVYIHSKLMIIDDRKTVIGSANINDRSMAGYKDSEICMIVEDTLHVDSTMDGRPYRAGPFSYNLRMKTWGDNMGLKAEDFGIMEDPLSDEFWERFKGLARNNTRLYEKAFPGLIPSNRITKLSQMNEVVEEEEEVNNRKTKIDSVHSDTIGVSIGGLEDLDKMDVVLEEGEEVMELQQNPFASPEALRRSAADDGKRVVRKTGSRVDGGRSRTKSQMEAMSKPKGTIKMNKDKGGTRMAEVFETLGQIKGILCEYPVDFLKDDFSKLKTNLIPSEIFK